MSYAASWGQLIASLPSAVEGPQPLAGSEAALLFEGAARTGVAPTLLGVEFFFRAAQDIRQSLAPAERRDGPNRLTAAVLRTLAGDQDDGVGELSLEDDQLTLLTDDAEPISICLQRPIRVDISTSLRADDLAEVNIRVEQRDHSAYRAESGSGLRFKTVLPQKCVSSSVASEWVDAAYITPGDFEQLWQTLVGASGDCADELASALAMGGRSRKLRNEDPARTKGSWHASIG